MNATTSVNVRDINEIRAREPHRISESWDARTKRDLLGADGRLLLVAADHPARGALVAGRLECSTAMPNEGEIERALASLAVERKS
jgi:hypothetical protein